MAELKPIFSMPVLLVAAVLVSTSVAHGVDQPADAKTVAPSGHWPQWRGPNRDNIARETGLAKQWPEQGPPLVWRVHGLGDGISTVSLAGGRIFALSQYDKTEYVRALDERTGKHLWTARLAEALPQSRLMRWLTQRPPTVEGECVYAISLQGELACLQTADGKEVWRKNYTSDFAGQRGTFGYSDCPIAEGDKLICTPGGEEASIIALDKQTGKTLWKCAVPDGGAAAYANGVVAEIGGRRQFVTFLANTLVGVAVDDGQVLWRQDGVSDRGSHPHTPLVRNDQIICVNAFGNGIKLLKVAHSDGTFVVKEVFSITSQHLGRYQDDTVCLGDRLYDFGNGIFSCFDRNSGTTLLQHRFGKPPSAVTYADEHFYIHHSDGTIGLAEIREEKAVVKATFPLPDHYPSMGTTTPVVAAGRLYIREDDQLFCYDIRADAVDQAGTSASISLTLPTLPAPADHASQRPPRIGTDRAPDAIFVPTPHDVVDKMLQLADAKKSESVYDLGSGDGRIVIAAAKNHGCRAIGYEIDAELVTFSRRKVHTSGIGNLVSIQHADIFTVDLSKADIICTYLNPRLLERLMPQLEKLKPGSRIVSHQFEIPGVTPYKVVKVESEEAGGPHTLYLWIAPLKKNR